ncbi:MAG: septum site-determining protein MinC [Alcanivorax borkumensis]|jgi:septum site-determining protein MinC|uniref:Probable septum site-determining protein MinC n=1 Tax=Alcanivorax borkumensis (strain ATCC 700651 / DSM 11573 / NCIMB 13689 / SK2) TaxID=393595 RepID=Q0VQI0_ALCBS|nr:MULTISPECIES: septum site-determining protein MinC [Alcanivorax]OJH08714.1 MAG: septum site-determining protein MinC [Alcanivorax borkumensis]EUC71440.1 septum site-determining protein MinC [Alcanivorax sp. 97CO-5]PKG02867.1 septum site-determining protein MinC [Alcanivorax sp. 97CO-6]CAL16568.1 septum site-determining protein MinC [Alcanivorax borkumensis SK2]BAP14038.1 septum site-determining protein MinC [Alcanivorax sp. NBRC 101098]
MTAVVEEKTAIEFKGRMLMMTVLQLKNLDTNVLHQQVSQRLEDAAQWLQDAPVVIDVSPELDNDPVALMAAVDTLRSLGVNLVALARSEHIDADTASMLGLGTLSLAGGRDIPRRTEPAPASNEDAPEATPAAQHVETMVIDQPVRSGQQVYSRGDLIVLAPVSTGAEIMADGNIHVYSNLRGRALAGVRGNTSARIFCQQLNAELVSIAGHYRVAEDLPESYRNKPVHLCMQGDAMHFTALN